MANLFEKHPLKGMDRAEVLELHGPPTPADKWVVALSTPADTFAACGAAISSAHHPLLSLASDTMNGSIESFPSLGHLR